MKKLVSCLFIVILGFILGTSFPSKAYAYTLPAYLSVGSTQELYAGVNNTLAINLRDSNGIGIENKVIKFAGIDLGITDSNGQLIVTDFIPSASGVAVFSAYDGPALLAEVQAPIKLPIADLRIYSVERVSNGYMIVVENTGIGAANNVKVTFNDAEGVERKGYIPSVTGGASTEIFVRGAIVKIQTVQEQYSLKVPVVTKTPYREKVSYMDKVPIVKKVPYTERTKVTQRVPVTRKVAYSVYINENKITRYKTVTDYQNIVKYQNVTKYRTQIIGYKNIPKVKFVTRYKDVTTYRIEIHTRNVQKEIPFTPYVSIN